MTAQGAESRTTAVKTLRDLKALIKGAAAGDHVQLKHLLTPFVGEGERLIDSGISAKFGILPTYDFYFLTEQLIGDLEITPFTGSLNVEVAYLDKIDAFVLTQPRIPILLRLLMLVLYVGLIGFLVNPLLKRILLRLLKSGLYLKLTGANVGTLIFADRNRFALVSKLARELSRLKRVRGNEAA